MTLNTGRGQKLILIAEAGSFMAQGIRDHKTSQQWYLNTCINYRLWVLIRTHSLRQVHGYVSARSLYLYRESLVWKSFIPEKGLNEAVWCQILLKSISNDVAHLLYAVKFHSTFLFLLYCFL